jgi:hypothetical protein
MGSWAQTLAFSLFLLFCKCNFLSLEKGTGKLRASEKIIGVASAEKNKKIITEKIKK